MKKRYLLLFLVVLLQAGSTLAQEAGWKPVGDKINTPWAEKLDPAAPLPEYPRPQLVREQWQNLNGLWEYALTPQEQSNPPERYQGQILVPFPLESSLSGVGRRLGADSVLWYRNRVTIPAAMRRQKLLLHFGAVDWQSQLWVNGRQVGSHEGGYDPFYFDITPYLRRGQQQEIVLRVWDPTDAGPQARGKQVREPHAIWYTPVSGIWQTVWLEPVPQSYIVATRQTPDIISQSLQLEVSVENARPGDRLRITALAEGRQVAQAEVAAGSTARLQLQEQQLWSPENPFLYDLEISLLRRGQTLDAVKSYFGMRQISMAADAQGVQRMLLNGKFRFQFGLLDQGWWPDGLYTAPTDEALLFDIEQSREMGFNMIRKHVKVEPARWYYHADRLGMLVWQDMPNGDWGGRWGMRPGVVGDGEDMERSEASEKIFRTEWAAIMDALHNFPSIVVWVPFNEGWGQFKTTEITEWTMERDTSRLVNSASGGNFHPVGHILDIHNYPTPAMPRADLFGRQQILVLGEYGGLGLPLEGHTWQGKDNWGYQSFKDADSLFETYSNYIGRLEQMIPKGLSAAIYTQTTDVEIETNGLITYDRRIIKLPAGQLRELHQRLYQAAETALQD
jgi:beta-galactosidase/beta-glucuronidase